MKKAISVCLLIAICLCMCACAAGNTPTAKQENVSDSQKNATTAETKSSPIIEETQKASTSGLRPEFKEAMDAYEAFYNEYCSFMLKFKENPSDISLILKYTEMLGELEQMSAAFDSWDEAEMNSEELQYYLEVSSRVMQKLLEVTG